MKAAILRAPGTPLTVEKAVLDVPGPREVLIRTAACGLCHSDLHFILGTYPHPLPAYPAMRPPAWSRRSGARSAP